MADVAKGSYDPYIKQWAIEAKRIKKPIFLRLGHEMNDPYRYPWGPQNNTAKDFIAAWQHVHQVFVSVGANNVIWIWSPHPAYGYFADFYPGNAYVDYVGVGTLNYGTIAVWSKWWSFKDIFGKYYADLAAFNKPIMLTELGSLAVGGNRSKWFEDAMADIPKLYPAVKSILFFHHGEDRTTTQQTLNWQIINDAGVKKSILNQISQWPDSIKAPLSN
jgi:beta-mannanase